MSRITQLIKALQKKDIQGEISEEQAIDALRSLPNPVRHPVPIGFDDSKDYSTELMLLKIQQPKMLKILPKQIRTTQLQTKNRGITKISPLVLNNVGLDVAPFVNFFSNQLPGSKVAVANIISPTGPVLRVRVQALICRNSDGKLTSGQQGQTKEEMSTAIDKIIDAVNKIYNGTGIEFIFYPSADVEMRSDTQLNQDFILNATEQPVLYPGTSASDKLEDLTAKYSTDKYRAEICKQYPQKLVLLFAEGTSIASAPTQSDWRRCKKCESLFFGGGQQQSHCASGGNHDADQDINYTLYIFSSDGFSADPTSADLQKGWRWCSKCQSLFFSGGGASSCVVGGQHDGSTSAFYVLDYISSLTESTAQIVDNKSQDNWRWCKNCQGLFLADNKAASNCPAGGVHSLEGSGDYILLSDKSAPRHIVLSPSGGGFSWEDTAYAKLSAEVSLTSPDIESYATFVAHEIGHYLSLRHTFVQFTVPASMQDKTAAEKVTYLQDEIRKHLEGEVEKKNVSKENILDALNGDINTGILDTPPDDSGELIHYLNVAANASSDACGPIGSCSIPLSDGTTVSYTPDRSIVMSYFKGCLNFNQRFSVDQAIRMRKHLIDGFRRSLVAVQLGDTATPEERMCAVWSPNMSGQAYISGYTIEDFKKKCSDMNKANFRLTHQQAYTRNGITLYDGIFNPGTIPEFKIWGWAIQDFNAKDAELVKTAWRLIHIESYLLPNGDVRVNAIWNQNNWATSWVQGFSFGDMDQKIKSWQNQGWQPVHINAYHLTNKEVRYDAIARPGNIRLPYFLGWAEEDFKKLYDDMWKKNHKLTLLDCTRAGDGTLRFNGVFQPDAQAQYITWNATREQIRKDYDEMWASGMKLRTMNMLRG